MAIQVQILTINKSPIALRVKSVGGWEVKVNRLMDSVMEKIKKYSNDTHTHGQSKMKSRLSSGS